ncbi:MAG: DUF1800 domain-containing protein, partial [Parvularculaceae bacterium]
EARGRKKFAPPPRRNSLRVAYKAASNDTLFGGSSMAARAKDLEAAIAATRFGLGARPGELAKIGDARGWLLAQTASPAAFKLEQSGLVTTKEATEALASYREMAPERQAAKASGEKMKAAAPAAASNAGDDPVFMMLRDLSVIATAEITARANRALGSQTSFAERLVYFWANHFTVAAVKATTIPFVGVFEREAIRERMTGSFADLLLAVVRHPGMLLYLDQAQSVGPNSPGGRRRGLGLNENLAREILELMTLGVHAGYTQADVTEFARALTGWTFAGPRTRRFARGAPIGDFIFVDLLHEPGARTVMGKRYADGGEDQAEAILRDIARHQATARHIATKLARHFVADAPPESAIAALEQVFLETDGDLPSLHQALVALPEAWAGAGEKFKAPNEFLLSALRMVGVPKIEERGLLAGYGLVGQTPYRASSPEGWPDDAASWAAPDAVMKRLEWCQALAERTGGRVKPEALAKDALGPLLSAATIEAASRAQSAAQGLVLVLMSPDFQRR